MKPTLRITSVLASFCLALFLAGCGDDDQPGPPAPTSTPTASAVPTTTSTPTLAPTATPTANPLAQACLDAGGTVSSAPCCTDAGDFPDLCAVGACGCAPENSVDTAICNCGEGRCFDGTTCVSRLEQACTESGGAVMTAPCCTGAGAFPDTCAIGTCGCAPENSTDTALCVCGEGRCFDGTGCINSRQRACTDSGGTTTTASCCIGAGEFPDTCAVGACGCSPESSADTPLCQCPTGECFDGTGCVPTGS